MFHEANETFSIVSSYLQWRKGFFRYGRESNRWENRLLRQLSRNINISKSYEWNDYVFWWIFKTIHLYTELLSNIRKLTLYPNNSFSIAVFCSSGCIRNTKCYTVSHCFGNSIKRNMNRIINLFVLDFCL